MMNTPIISSSVGYEEKIEKTVMLLRIEVPEGSVG
jgi:hypothetical protein